MEITEARQLLGEALNHFLNKELPKNRRILILMKQVEALGYEALFVIQAKPTITVNKAAMRHLRKTKKRLRPDSK